MEHTWASKMELETVVQGPNGLLGERAMLSEAPADATCRTLTFSEAFFMEAAGIRAVLLHYPVVREQTRKRVAKKLWRYVVYSGKFVERLKLFAESKEAAAAMATPNTSERACILLLPPSEVVPPCEVVPTVSKSESARLEARHTGGNLGSVIPVHKDPTSNPKRTAVAAIRRT